MDTVKELQHSLSQLIYSITDIKSLSQIKTTVDRLIVADKKNGISNGAPWGEAVLKMKPITSYEDVVKSQGDKKLTFEELYPHIDDNEDEYSIDDLLNALN